MGWFRRKEPEVRRPPPEFRTDLPAIDSTPVYRVIFRELAALASRPIGGVKRSLLVSEGSPTSELHHRTDLARAWLYEDGVFRALSCEEFQRIVADRGKDDPFPTGSFHLVGDRRVILGIAWRALAARVDTYFIMGPAGDERLELDPNGLLIRS